MKIPSVLQDNWPVIAISMAAGFLIGTLVMKITLCK